MRGLLVICLVAFSANAQAQDRTILTVPISAPIADVQSYADQALPGTLHRASTSQRCVEPKQACTKIPEFRGFKIYSRMECVQVTSGIDCSIDHNVWRDGPLRLSGSGRSLTLQQAVSARATVRGRGEIGKHIRETVNGSADFTITASPAVNPDWSVVLPMDAQFRWINRPRAMILNVIPVTFGTEAGNALNRQIDNFKSNTLPGELAKIDLRAKVAPLWKSLQEPQRIEIDEATYLYLHVRPDAVGLAPLTVANGRIETVASIAGRSKVTTSRTWPFAQGKTAVPNLTPVPNGPTSISVPVQLDEDTLTEALARELPQTVRFEDPVSGSIEVRSATLSVQGRNLVVQLDVKATTASFTTYDGPMTLIGSPRWNRAVNTLSLADARLSVDTPGIASSILNAILETAAFRDWLVNQATVSLDAEVKKAEIKLNEALNRNITPQLRLSADMDLSLARINVSDQVTLYMTATGPTRLSGLLVQ